LERVRAARATGLRNLPLHDTAQNQIWLEIVMESFFSLLQKNVLNRRQWTTRQELRIAIVTWIERTYHRRRRQASLGRLTPIEFETVMTTQALQAA
jgi:transposase InsO family protein